MFKIMYKPSFDNDSHHFSRAVNRSTPLIKALSPPCVRQRYIRERLLEELENDPYYILPQAVTKLLGPALRRENRLRKLLEVIPAVKRGVKPNLMYIVPYDIYRGVSGGAQRILQLARGLSAAYNVKVITIGGLETESKEVYPDVDIIRVPMEPDIQKRVLESSNETGPAAHIATVAEHSEGLKSLRLVMDYFRDETSVFIFTAPWLVSLAEKLPSGRTIIYDVHDVAVDHMDMLLPEEAESRGRLLSASRQREERMLQTCTFYIPVTQNDANRLTHLYDAERVEYCLIPNGVRADECIAFNGDQKRMLRERVEWFTPTILFMGPEYKPNVEALDFINQRLAPALPHIQFVHIGLGKKAYRNTLADNLLLTGKVSELAKETIMALANMAICPLELGGGSSLKAADFIAHKLPLIATPKGMRGFEDLSHWVEIVDRGEMIECIENSIDPASRVSPRLTENAEKAHFALLKHWCWKSIANRLLERLAHVKA